MENKTALITGASSGIGYELARLFARDRYNLVIVSRDEETLKEVAEECRDLGSSLVTVIPKDLSIPGAAAELYEQTTVEDIFVDVLVNNAAVGEYGFFAETNIERELDIIQLNISSVVHLTKLYMSDMIARRSGRILQVASVAAYQPTPLLSVYAATKAFVLSFSDSITNELKSTGVTITVLIPGATDTDFFYKANAENTRAALDNPANPADVARAGYYGLLRGEHHVVSGTSAHVQVALSNILPTETLAAMARRQMEEKK